MTDERDELAAAVSEGETKWFVAGGLSSEARHQAIAETVANAGFRKAPAVSKLDLDAGICSCGNRFDGDNLCMASACQMEGFEDLAPAASEPQPGDSVRVTYENAKGEGHFYDETVRPNGTYTGYQDVLDGGATVEVIARPGLLASHPVTDEAVERVARALYESNFPPAASWTEWPDLDESDNATSFTKANYRNRARAAIEALGGQR
jgi:hypothetical protein